MIFNNIKLLGEDVKFINKVINKYSVEGDVNLEFLSQEDNEPGKQVYLYKSKLGDLSSILPKLDLPSDYTLDDFYTKFHDLHWNSRLVKDIEKSMYMDLRDKLDLNDVEVEVSWLESNVEKPEDLKNVEISLEVTVTFHAPDKLETLTRSAFQLALKKAWSY